MMKIKEIKNIIILFIVIGLIILLWFFVVLYTPIQLPAALPTDEFHFDEYVYCDQEKLGLLTIHMRTEGVLSARRDIFMQVQFIPDTSNTKISSDDIVKVSFPDAYPKDVYPLPAIKQKDINITLTYDNNLQRWKGSKNLQYMSDGDYYYVIVFINSNNCQLLDNIIDIEDASVYYQLVNSKFAVTVSYAAFILSSIILAVSLLSLKSRLFKE